MSKVKITALTELTTPDNADFLAIVDTDEPQLDEQTKKITVGNLTAGLNLSLPLNNKGDLLSHNGSNVVGVPISTTNGYVLTVNDSQPAGIEWAAATGAGNPFLFVNSVIAALNANLPDVTGTDAIGLGADATVAGVNALGLGVNTSAANVASVAIGYESIASGDGAIVLGTRTDGAAAIAGGLKSIAIGASAGTAQTGAVVIGPDSFSAGTAGIAIGNSAIVGDSLASLPNGNNAIAIGSNAIAEGPSSIQLGTGTNTLGSTLQYLTTPLADASGLLTAHTPVNYTAADSNVDTHLAGLDSALRLVNESITSGTEITVTPGVSSDRLFITPTATIDLILDTTGATNTTYFVLVNVDPGGGDINIKIDNNTNPTVLTLDSGTNNVSVAYDGTDYKLWA